jgi:hypothetical protein
MVVTRGADARAARRVRAQQATHGSVATQSLHASPLYRKACSLLMYDKLGQRDCLGNAQTL